MCVCVCVCACVFVGGGSARVFVRACVRAFCDVMCACVRAYVSKFMCVRMRAYA